MSWSLAIAILGVIGNIYLVAGPLKAAKTIRAVFMVILVFNLMYLLSKPELYQFLGLR